MARDITQLHPELQQKANQLLELAAGQGLAVKITDCVRNSYEQADCVARGTSSCRYPNSMHNWGVAFDFCRNDGAGAYNDSDGWFTKVGRIAESIDLEWGGSWTSPVDKPHCQLSDWGTGTALLRITYGTPDAFMTTWKKAAVAEWIKEGSRWWYRHADGSYTKNNWELINGKWYFFDNKGWMEASKWIDWKNDRYYVQKNGAMQTGWLLDAGKWYYFNADGKMVRKKWVQHTDKHWYYLGEDGVMLTSQFVKDGDYKYYLLADGRMAVGWIVIDREWYYFTKDKPAGHMITEDFIAYKGNKCYLKKSGKMARNEEITIKTDEGENTYSFDKDGYLIK